MAYYFLTASKDASVYLQQPDQNTGLDEILEVSKVYYGNLKDTSRAFLKFDIQPLSQSISNGSVQLNEATLVLKETDSEEVPLEFDIEIYPLSQSWEMGVGTRYDEISTGGVSWKYREGDSKLEWLPTKEFEVNTTGSYEGLGGVWYSDVYSIQTFNYKTSDIEADIKDIVEDWISGSKVNEGLVVKFPLSKEGDTNDYGILKFFSKETNTIHQPKIRIGWDDSSFTTGSLTEISSNSIKVGISNFKKEYKVNTTPKIRVVGRDLYPQKTFNNTFRYSVSQYLSENSFYQISDYHSGDVVIPFSNYTKISCDNEGNYFNLNLSNWEADRVYKIEFKIEVDGSYQYFDDDYTFKVV